MARIDYAAITEAIAAVITSDPNVRKARATVDIAKPAPIGIGMMPFIGVYEKTWTAQGVGQALAGGTRNRQRIRWDIWVVVFSAAGYRDAAGQRDDLLGHVQVALMANRNLNGTLSDHSLDFVSGELRSGPFETGLLAEGSIGITAEETATT